MILVCPPGIYLVAGTLKLVRFPLCRNSPSTWSFQTPSSRLPDVPPPPTLPTGLCARRGFGPSHFCCVDLKTQAGPFVPRDKRKKDGHGRRINLSPAQTTHLLVVLISCLSLLRFLLLSFLLSRVRAEDIGSGCTVNSQSRDTSLPPFSFFSSSGYSGTQSALLFFFFVRLCTKAAAFKRE